MGARWWLYEHTAEPITRGSLSQDADRDRKQFDGGVYRYHPVKHVWDRMRTARLTPWGH